MASPPTGLVRAIGRWSLAALTINSVIGSAVFGLPATVAGLLGKDSIQAVVIAGVAVGIIMACFAEVASQFSEAGGPYLYARSAFGRFTGILVGWMFYLAQTAAPAANANLFVIYLAEFFPDAKQTWPRFAILTALIGMLVIINILGARQGTAVSNLFTVAKILPLLMVVLAGTAVTLIHPAPLAATSPPDARTWLKALVPLFFYYGGFESALAPMGEAKNPRRNSVFALLVSLVVCASIYTAVQWVVVGVLGSNAATDRPLAEVARATMGNPGAALAAIGALLSVYGYLSAKLLSMPRVTYALAEQQDLPRFFAAVSGRFRTPWISILIYGAVVWGLAIAGSFVWNVTLSVVSRLFYYGAISAAVIVLRRRPRRVGALRLPAGSLFSILGVLISTVLITQVDLSKSLILVATIAAAVLNWLWARYAHPIKA